MKTKLKKIQKENTNLSSLICFIKLIRKDKYKKGEIREGFNKLVNKSDYQGTNKKELLDFILSI